MDAAGERPAGTGFGLPRQARITASAEIRALLRRGKRSRTRHLDVFVSASPGAFPRLGLIVPRHRQKVVKRNLLKRRLRELGRTMILPPLRAAEHPVDVLIRVRPEAYGASFAELSRQLQPVVERLCSQGS